MLVGKANPNSPRTVPKPEDVYTISYTSGTTGDSKGVKLNHRNFLTSAMAGVSSLGLVEGESVLSYLPFAHVYEQAMFCISLFVGLKIGFYQGNPLKLIEDCATLKPAIFPSVPRLYNKIYSSL